MIEETRSGPSGACGGAKTGRGKSFNLQYNFTSIKLKERYFTQWIFKTHYQYIVLQNESSQCKMQQICHYFRLGLYAVIIVLVANVIFVIPDADFFMLEEVSMDCPFP